MRGTSDQLIESLVALSPEASQRVRKRVEEVFRYDLPEWFLPVEDEMPKPKAPAARSGAVQSVAYSESAFNGASVPTPARSLMPNSYSFIRLWGGGGRAGHRVIIPLTFSNRQRRTGGRAVRTSCRPHRIGRPPAIAQRAVLGGCVCKVAHGPKQQKRFRWAES